MKGPLEIALSYPVEVNGVVHDKLVIRNKVAGLQRRRRDAAVAELAHLFDVSPAVIRELDEIDLQIVSGRLDDYLASLEG